MTDVVGPYCMNYTGTQIHVCGRYGKIVQRYPETPEGEQAAQAHLELLMRGYIAPPAKPVKLTKAQAEVLSRAREGIQYRAPQLGGVFVDCQKRGWINADPTEYGLHVTLTAAGMQVKP